MTSLQLVLAAQAAVDAVKEAGRLEDGNGHSTDLYHLLRATLEWCDQHGLNFDAVLSDLRADIAAER